MTPVSRRAACDSFTDRKTGRTQIVTPHDKAQVNKTQTHSVKTEFHSVAICRRLSDICDRSVPPHFGDITPDTSPQQGFIPAEV